MSNVNPNYFEEDSPEGGFTTLLFEPKDMGLFLQTVDNWNGRSMTVPVNKTLGLRLAAALNAYFAYGETPADEDPLFRDLEVNDLKLLDEY